MEIGSVWCCFNLICIRKSEISQKRLYGRPVKVFFAKIDYFSKVDHISKKLTRAFFDIRPTTHLGCTLDYTRWPFILDFSGVMRIFAFPLCV